MKVGSPVYVKIPLVGGPVWVYGRIETPGRTWCWVRLDGHKYQQLAHIEEIRTPEAHDAIILAL